MSKLTILVFTLAYRPYVGGAEIALEEIMRRLPQFRFIVVTARALKNFQKAKLMEVEEKGNVKIIRVGSDSPWLGQYLYPFVAVRRAFKEFLDNKPACVWGMLESYGGMAATMFKQREMEVPYLLTMQSGDSEVFWKRRTWFWGPLYKKVFQNADEIQVISKYLGERARNLGAKCEISVIPNGVEVQKFLEPLSQEIRSEIRNKWGMSDRDIAIITTSRLVKKNGVDTLIKGFSEWRQRNKDKKGVLLIAGKGPLASSLKGLAKRKGVESEVVWLGQLPYSELPKYYKSADIFIRPSRSEGLGNSFLEAMAAGIPVIGTPVGGIPDFLENEKTGLLIEPDDVNGLVQAVEKLVSDGSLRESIVKDASSMVKERYSWERIAAEVGKVIGDLGHLGP